MFLRRRHKRKLAVKAIAAPPTIPAAIPPFAPGERLPWLVLKDVDVEDGFVDNAVLLVSLVDMADEAGVTVVNANNTDLSIAYVAADGFADLLREENVSFIFVALSCHTSFSNPLQQMLNCCES